MLVRKVNFTLIASYFDKLHLLNNFSERIENYLVIQKVDDGYGRMATKVIVKAVFILITIEVLDYID